MSYNIEYTICMRIGIDEVGRGAFAGPVYVCAFGTDLSDKELLMLFSNGILKDSKKLTKEKRIDIFRKLETLKRENRVYWKIGKQSARFIDTYGLTKAISSSLEKCLAELEKKNKASNKKSVVYLDGGLRAPIVYKQETIIKGDEKIPVIACASIVAKVLRDKYMGNLSKKYPLYGFINNVGYGTKLHADSIEKNGITKEHRTLFLRNFFAQTDKRASK